MRYNRGISIVELTIALSVSSFLIVCAVGMARINEVNLDSSILKNSMLDALVQRVEYIKNQREDSEGSFPVGVATYDYEDFTQNVTIAWIDTFTQSISVESFPKVARAAVPVKYEEIISLPQNSQGQDMCSPFFRKLEPSLLKNLKVSFPLGLGTGQVATDIYVRNGIVFLTSDSATQSHHDLHIYDAHATSSIRLLSSRNSGAGLNALAIVGKYLYAANTNVASQLQVFDISDYENPSHVTSIQVPLPTPTTTPPVPTTLTYYGGKLYLGTEKWQGPELMVFNLENPRQPAVTSTFETNTLINNIHVRGNFIYVAASDVYQMRVLELQSGGVITLKETFSPSGHEVQEGKRIEQLGDQMYFARTVGGFNNIRNHEFFEFGSANSPIIPSLKSSLDIPGGVYGMYMHSTSSGVIATGNSQKYLQLIQAATSAVMWDIKESFELPHRPVKIVCDGSRLYVALQGETGFSILSP